MQTLPGKSIKTKKLKKGAINPFSIKLHNLAVISLMLLIIFVFFAGCKNVSPDEASLQATGFVQENNDYDKSSKNNDTPLEVETNKQENNNGSEDLNDGIAEDKNGQQAQVFSSDNSDGKTGGANQNEDEITTSETVNNKAASEGEEIIIDLKPPQVQLEIIIGPQYAQDNNVCFYRVKATVTGDPYPQIQFNRDDSKGAWGENIAQVNLLKDETFTLICSAQNSQGAASSNINIQWREQTGQLNDNQAELSQAEGEAGYSNPANYLIDVSLGTQKVDVFYLGNIIRSMPCSGGKPETPTPLGTFTTNQKIYWAFVPKFGQGAYYWTRFYGSYLFHSVPYDENKNLLTEELAKIGQPASHGCIRLYLEDAKWMYDMLPLGIEVKIHY